MNRKYLYISCAVGLLLVALVAVMLLGDTGNETSAAGQTTVGIADTTKRTEQSSATQGQNSAEQTQQVAGTEVTPSFDVEFGVGGELIFEEETETPSEQKPTVTAPSATTKPTTDQNTGKAETTQSSDTENSGMPSKLLTYEEFLALTSAEQQAYFFLFKDPLDYAKWMQKAQKEYQDGQTSIIVTGPVDLSTLPTDGNKT